VCASLGGKVRGRRHLYVSCMSHAKGGVDTEPDAMKGVQPCPLVINHSAFHDSCPILHLQPCKHLWQHPNCSMSSVTTSMSLEGSMSTYNFTTSPPTNNVPGLTTVFTYATECRNLWVLPLPESLPYNVCNSFASTSSPDVYYDIF
jgi:hypothetical protein